MNAAIPTVYKGIRFRSRLEAKWARVFDILGENWEYEPIELNGWIPDFVLAGGEKPILVECKPIIDGKLPADVPTKIERALNLPAWLGSPYDGWFSVSSPELLKEGPYRDSTIRVSEIFKQLPYDIIIVGARVPCCLRYNSSCDTGTVWNPPNFWGWCWQLDWECGWISNPAPWETWESKRLALARVVESAWLQAKNDLQWKAKT